MTPQEKALSLCQKFGRTTLFAEDCNNGYTLPLRVSKLCANIAIDEVLEFMRMDDEYNEDCHMVNTHWIQYWQQVKEEINKI